MSQYKRNQQGQFRNTKQDWRRDKDWIQHLNQRDEDVYGRGADYRGEGYSRNVPSRSISDFANTGVQQRSPGFRYGDQEGEDFGNYGRGGYYGLTYDSEGYNRARKQQMEFNQNDQGNDLYNDARKWQEPDLSVRTHKLDDRNETRTRVTGTHVGKGPRNYRRSDERISNDINDRLADDSFVDASDIEVIVKNCEVVLAGTVESRDAKKRAEDIGESVSGVKNVENRLRVKRNDDRSNGGENFESRTIGNQ
jgi:osmotically-inducible protein OsmY